MEMIELLKEFGTWGILVLIAAMAGTHYVKPHIKKAGANDWVIMATPVVMAGIGSSALWFAGKLALTMVPLYTFVIGFGGNVLYRGFRKVRG